MVRLDDVCDRDLGAEPPHSAGVDLARGHLGWEDPLAGRRLRLEPLDRHVRKSLHVSNETRLQIRLPLFISRERDVMRVDALSLNNTSGKGIRAQLPIAPRWIQLGLLSGMSHHHAARLPLSLSLSFSSVRRPTRQNRGDGLVRLLDAEHARTRGAATGLDRLCRARHERVSHLRRDAIARPLRFSNPETGTHAGEAYRDRRPQQRSLQRRRQLGFGHGLGETRTKKDSCAPRGVHSSVDFQDVQLNLFFLRTAIGIFQVLSARRIALGPEPKLGTFVKRCDTITPFGILHRESLSFTIMSGNQFEQRQSSSVDDQRRRWPRLDGQHLALIFRDQAQVRRQQ